MVEIDPDMEKRYGHNPHIFADALKSHGYRYIFDIHEDYRSTRSPRPHRTDILSRSSANYPFSTYDVSDRLIP